MMYYDFLPSSMLLWADGLQSGIKHEKNTFFHVFDFFFQFFCVCQSHPRMDFSRAPFFFTLPCRQLAIISHNQLAVNHTSSEVYFVPLQFFKETSIQQWDP